MKKFLHSKRGRLLLGYLLAGWVVLLLLGTLYPFRFSADPAKLKYRTHPIEWIPFTYVCPQCGYELPDKLLNLVMFVPFGFLTGLRPLVGGVGKAGLARLTLFGFLLSLGIEVTQYYLPTRVPGASDVFCNTLGAFLGGWLSVRLYVASGMAS